MANMKLNLRKQQVLEAIVEDHIATAEPVSSRTIARKYRLGVSPATIRNEMADLEEIGLIEQPHTSAGRVPSQQGYRYYVDWLMRRSQLSEYEEKLIRSVFGRKAREVVETVQQVIKMASQLTDYLVFLSGPQLEYSPLHRVRFVPLAPGKALLVIVAETGWVENKLIDLPAGANVEEMERVELVFNTYFRGLTFPQITRTILQSVYDELARQRQLVDLAMEVIESVLNSESGDALYLGGTRNILKQPEYQDVHQVHRLLNLVEEEGVLRNLLDDARENGVTVKIGKENRNDQVHDCSVITASYSIAGSRVGAFGLLGPMRMDYARAIALVEYITQVLSEVLTRSDF